jgi:hypothetical protein
MDRRALTHYSATPLGPLKSATQTPEDGRGWQFIDKPKGLWVSVDGEDDWLNWCIGTGFRLGDLAVHHRLTLKEPDRLLWLTGRPQLEQFQTRYGAPRDYGMRLDMRAINWASVASDYAGLIITPYVWSGRHKLMWYYGWDCASGCIWDVSVIESVQIVEAAAHD